MPRIKKKPDYYLILSEGNYKYGVFPRTPEGKEAASKYKIILEKKNGGKFSIK